MTNPIGPDDTTLEWVQKLIEIDEAVRSGTAPDETALGEDFAQAPRLMRNLQAMHAVSRQPEPLSHPAGIPDKIGRYHLQRMIGAGGFAIVYLARDDRLRRDVAIKVPLPPGLLNLNSRQRFLQEAQLAAQLDHPHIVPAYEAGEDGPIPFIAYAYCSGPTLSDWLKSHGPMEPLLAAGLVSRLADAVSYSHDRGILHRDLKPANVLLFPSRRGDDQKFPFTPKLSDFGLAKLMESAATETGSSVILGTPIYMAPEQIETSLGGSPTSPDVYGLGGILFEVLTGHPPFAGETVVKVLETVRNGKFEKVRKRNPAVPQEIAVICEKALSIRPEDRYHSAAEMQADLDRFLNGERITGRPPSARRRAVRSLESSARISEAAGYVILSHIVILCWICAWPFATLFGFAMTDGMSLADLMPYTLPLIVVHSLFILLGWQISRRREWAALLSAVAGGLLSLFVFAVLVRWISPPYPSVYQNERTRDIIFLLLLWVFAVHTLLCSVAWKAIRARGSR